MSVQSAAQTERWGQHHSQTSAFTDVPRALPEVWVNNVPKFNCLLHALPGAHKCSRNHLLALGTNLFPVHILSPLLEMKSFWHPEYSSIKHLRMAQGTRSSWTVWHQQAPRANRIAGLTPKSSIRALHLACPGKDYRGVFMFQKKLFKKEFLLLRLQIKLKW